MCKLMLKSVFYFICYVIIIDNKGSDNMFCPKCGFKNNEDAVFCGQCGNPLGGVEPTPNQMVNNQPGTVNNPEQRTINVNPYPNATNDTNQALDPNMKKFATMSVVIPSISLFLCLFVGFIPLLAWVLGGLCINFSNKGQAGDPKLAKVGKILSIILIIMGVIMFVMALSGQ